MPEIHRPGSQKHKVTVSLESTVKEGEAANTASPWVLTSVYRWGSFLLSLVVSEYMTHAVFAWVGMGNGSGQEIRRPGLIRYPPLVASIYPSERRELGFSIFILYKPKNSI